MNIFKYFLITIFCSVTVTFSATLYVSPLSEGTGDCLSESNSCDLQTAFSIAQSNGEGDNILIKPGEYNFTTSVTYQSDNGDSGNFLVVEALDPKNKPVLKSSGEISIETDTSGDKGDINGDITIKNIEFQMRVKIVTREAEILVENCIFDSISGNSYYGKIYIYPYISKGYFRNNKVLNNSSNENMKGTLGIYTLFGQLFIYNNLFANNSNQGLGGAVYSFSNRGSLYIYNNTFFNNSASEGGAYYIKQLNNASSVNIYNNIFWENTATKSDNSGDDIYINSDGDDDGTGANIKLYNNITGENSNYVTGQSEDIFITKIDNFQAGDNKSTNPKFKNTSDNDFRISSSSPAIDMGTDSLPKEAKLPDKDIDGNDRIIDGNGDNTAIIDIGAYEYVPSSGGGGGCSFGYLNTNTGLFIILTILILFINKRYIYRTK